MLSVEEIVNHIDNHLKPWLDADLILNIQYLIRVGVKKQMPVLKVIGINCPYHKRTERLMSSVAI